MKVAVIGATGHVGASIVGEAADRGHDVHAVSRSGGGARPNVQPQQADVHDRAALVDALQGCEAVVHAFNPGRGRIGREVYDEFVAGHAAILEAVKAAGIERLLCVGGAGSLKTRDGTPLVDSSEWPPEFEAYKDGVYGTRELYYMLQREPAFDWIFLSPPNLLTDGPRTGAYRTGSDWLLYDENGVSQISIRDYAVAMIDELERARHHGARFTVGY